MGDPGYTCAWDMTGDRTSRRSSDGRPTFLQGWNGNPVLHRTAGLAHTGSCLEKRHPSTGQTAIVDKLVAHRAPRPPTTQHGLIPIEIFFTDSADARFDRKRHRLPLSAAFSNTHKWREYSGTTGGKTSEDETLLGLAARNPIAWLALQMHQGRNKDGLPIHGVDQETAGGDSAETDLSKYATYEGVVESDGRPTQQHQGIPDLAPDGNLRRILHLDGFRG